MVTARTLVTTGRAAEILGVSRWGVRYLVAQRVLEPWRAWELQGVGKSTQHMFRLDDVVALLARRAQRVHAEQLEERRRRTLKPKTVGTQLEFFFPPAVRKVLPWIPKPKMARAGETLRQRLVREGKQAGRLKVAGRRR
jgi:hypothetical protein